MFSKLNKLFSCSQCDHQARTTNCYICGNRTCTYCSGFVFLDNETRKVCLSCMSDSNIFIDRINRARDEEQQALKEWREHNV